MAIRYKVVTQKRRSIFVCHSPYSLQYFDGETVKAPDGTLGIFVFETLNYAKQFIKTSSAPNLSTILKVETSTRGKKLYVRPTSFGRQTIWALSRLRKDFLKINHKAATKYDAYSLLVTEAYQTNATVFKDGYDGTMVYDQVKVLGDVEPGRNWRLPCWRFN